MSVIELQRLESVLDGMANQRILVLGDVMLDRYLWGDTERISPEAPVPVIDARDETSRLGGAANVAHNVRSLGGEARLVGLCGDDGFGLDLSRLLDASGISPECLVTSSRRTTCKTRILARNQQVVRVDREDLGEIDGETATRVLEVVERELLSSAALILSDYGKGLIGPRLLGPVLTMAKQQQVPICVDPKLDHFYEYRGVTVIKPNQHEAAHAHGAKIDSDADLLAAGRGFLQRLEARSVLVTRGERGMVLFQPDAEPLTFPALSREVFDVTGAGDTVVAVFALAVASGASLPEATALSNHAASLVVRQVGTAVPDRAALLRSVREEPDRWAPTILGAST